MIVILEQMALACMGAMGKGREKDDRVFIRLRDSACKAPIDCNINTEIIDNERCNYYGACNNNSGKILCEASLYVLPVRCMH